MLSTIILGIMEFIVLAIGFAAGFWLIIAAGKEERWKKIMGSIFGWILIAYALIISTMICFKWIDYIQTGKLMESSSMSPMMKKEGGCPMMKQMMKQMKNGNMPPMMKQMMKQKMKQKMPMQMKKQMQKPGMSMKKMKEKQKGKEIQQSPVK